MELRGYRFDEISVNYDKKRIPLSGTQREKRKGEYRYYGAQGVIDYIDDYIFDGTFLLIAEDGENLKSKKQNIAQVVNGQFWVNNHAHIVTGNDLCDTHYLCYLINSMDLSGYVTGSAQPKLSQANLNAVTLLLPRMEIQKKIVDYLRKIDEKIELNTQINKNLEQQAETLFISWFVDYIPFNGTKPDLWKNISVYELAEYINGAAFKKNEYADKGLPIIRITELKNGITDATQYCCAEKDVKYYIDDRDILFSWSGNPDTSIDTFLWCNGKAILNQHTFRVVSKYDAPAFTFFLLKYLKPQLTHIASNKQTTGLGHVTVADLKRLQFCADENAIREFNAITMPFFDMIFSNYKENQYLFSLRDTILPQLMSGELDISNIEL